MERIHFEAQNDGEPWGSLKRYGNLYSLYCSVPWPLPNVWLGVSAERQQEADERIPDLLATPAAVRFVSLEPLLGAIELATRDTEVGDISWLRGFRGSDPPIGRIDWVIVGGESGRHARPIHPDWARSMRDQCAAAGVAFFMKQWGEWKPLDQFSEKVIEGARGHGVISRDGQFIFDTDIADPPDRVFTWRVGKKAAGRLIDGIEHNAMPGGIR